MFDSDLSPVIRSDFSNQTAWDALRARIATPSEDEFLANVEYIEDPAYEGITPDQVHALFADDSTHAIAIVADTTTMNHSESPLLVIDLLKTATEIRVASHDLKRVKELRVIPSELWAIENNLSWSNMSFSEFVDSADDDGIFRGFAD